MRNDEGKWHPLLQGIRIQLTRGMDGEVSTQQRQLGLEYKVNFGVNILRLKDIAKDLPHDEELADLMWTSESREMRLLSIMIRDPHSLSHDKVLSIIKETDTLELSEQLVFVLLRRLPYAISLLKELFQMEIDVSIPPATIRYLLLNHMVLNEQLTPEVFKAFISVITRDFTDPCFYHIATIHNCLQKIVFDRPDLPMHDICNAVIAKGDSGTKALAEDLLTLIE